MGKAIRNQEQGSETTLQFVQQATGGFAQGQPVALGGSEARLRWDRLHGEALAPKGRRGTGKLPGIGDQQNWRTGMVVAQPIRGAGGVLPGGAGTGITRDPGRRNALALKGVSGADRIATHIHSRGRATVHDSSSERRGGFGHLDPATKQHQDRGRVLRGYGIR